MRNTISREYRDALEAAGARPGFIAAIDRHNRKHGSRKPPARDPKRSERLARAWSGDRPAVYLPIRRLVTAAALGFLLGVCLALLVGAWL